MIEPKGLVAADAKGVKFPSPGLFVDPNDPTRLLALVSQRFAAEAGNGLYGKIDLYSADVKKLNWERVGTVAKFPRSLGERNDLTYGWMTPVGGQKWLAVFYCGKIRGASDIYGLEFEVPKKKERRGLALSPFDKLNGSAIGITNDCLFALIGTISPLSNVASNCFKALQRLR